MSRGEVTVKESLCRDRRVEFHLEIGDSVIGESKRRNENKDKYNKNKDISN